MYVQRDAYVFVRWAWSIERVYACVWMLQKTITSTVDTIKIQNETYWRASFDKNIENDVNHQHRHHRHRNHHFSRNSNTWKSTTFLRLHKQIFCWKTFDFSSPKCLILTESNIHSCWVRRRRRELGKSWRSERERRRCFSLDARDDENGIRLWPTDAILPPKKNIQSQCILLLLLRSSFTANERFFFFLFDRFLVSLSFVRSFVVTFSIYWPIFIGWKFNFFFRLSNKNKMIETTNVININYLLSARHTTHRKAERMDKIESNERSLSFSLARSRHFVRWLATLWIPGKEWMQWYVEQRKGKDRERKMKKNSLLYSLILDFNIMYICHYCFFCFLFCRNSLKN